MTSRRIIYVTGMKPKPDPALHRPELMRVLAAALARIDPAAAEWLYAREQNFRLVSWTSLVYPAPADIATDLPGIRRLLEQPVPSMQDKRDADAFRRGLLRLWHLLGDSYSWLSTLVASPLLQVTLAEVRRYLHNEDGLAERVRRGLIEELEQAFTDRDRVLLIGHSLGSVIAYDCLWQLSHQHESDGRVDLFMTMGSPLATRFIRKGLLGAKHSGRDRYPTNIERWVNVSARGELVALHRRVKPFFSGMLRLGLIREIKDVPGIYNHFRAGGELNVHKSYGYLNHPFVAGTICRWLAD